MNHEEIQLIQETVIINGLPFYYYKDRYALEMLGWQAGEGKKISALKNGPFARLLEKPVVKQLLAQSGNGLISQMQMQMQNHWPESGWADFILSTSEWKADWKNPGDNWQQTSRPGRQLVLQLNFSQDHNVALYRGLRKNGGKHAAFTQYAHPVASRHLTLAWARLDVDLENDEVLIEEIQNDWLRICDMEYGIINKLLKAGRVEAAEAYAKTWQLGDMDKFLHYCDTVLPPYKAIWQEAMLFASIDFIRSELGISRIFYHTWETGNLVKRITYNTKPPRSLYTDLPARFGFRLTDAAPQMLLNCRKLKKILRRPDMRWYVLNI